MSQQETLTLLKTPYFSVVQEGRYYTIKERAEENGVVIAAQRDDGKLLLARLFRPAINSFSYEFPRGAIDEGENASQAAARELMEETGYGSAEVSIIGKLHSNTSLLSSYVAMAHVRAKEVDGSRTDGEVESMQWVSLEALNDMIKQGLVTDGHTLSTLAVFRANLD